MSIDWSKFVVYSNHHNVTVDTDSICFLAPSANKFPPERHSVRGGGTICKG